MQQGSTLTGGGTGTVCLPHRSRRGLHYVKLQYDGDALEQLLHRDRRFSALQREAAEVLEAVTGTTIPINQAEEVIDMCKGEKQLLQKAFTKGEQSGFTKGEQSGFAEGIRKAVLILKGLQLDMAQIQEKLMEAYALTADEARKYLLE